MFLVLATVTLSVKGGQLGNVHPGGQAVFIIRLLLKESQPEWSGIYAPRELGPVSLSYTEQAAFFLTLLSCLFLEAFSLENVIISNFSLPSRYK